MEWIRTALLMLILLLLISFFLPLRFHIEAEHRQTWKGKLTISFLWFVRTVELPAPAASFEKLEEQVEHLMEEGRVDLDSMDLPAGFMRSYLQDRWQRTSFQIHWRGAAVYAAKVAGVISKLSYVEDYQLRCKIGCSRPDCTAYLYGLFWTVLAVLPQQWLEQGSVTYLPDFQQKRQDVFFQGIIRCRVGQLIGIAVSLFWLTVKSMREQPKQHRNREYGKEQMVYES